MQPYVLGVPAFLVVLPFAIAAGMALPLALARRRGVAGWRIALFLTLTTLVALAGAKLYSVVERGELGPGGEELETGFR
jgi:hypothetical protein